MNISRRSWYYITVIAFPLFFILHGVNENYGLVRNSTIGGLLIYYLAIAVLFGLLGELLMKDVKRAIVFVFFTLFIFFFFGVFKDALKNIHPSPVLVSYKVLLPILAAIIFSGTYFIKSSKYSLHRTGRFLRLLLLILLIVETVVLIFNSLTDKSRQMDFGDQAHSLIKNISVPDTARKPYIFWIVMDEYSGSTGLKRKWNYNNPLDTILRNKGFFVADSARSSYNYTHYSLSSTLDMIYLDGLQEHSVIGYRDIVRGNMSLRENNVVELLRSTGYDIENYSIYNLQGHPTKVREEFRNADRKLIDNQTLTGRIKQDIGWNFRNLFSRNKHRADSIDHMMGIAGEARYRDALLKHSMNAAQEKKNSSVPAFFMFHFLYTHEPFLYNTDGSIDSTVGFGMYPEKYIPSVNFSNRVLSEVVDSIKKMYAGKDLVIVIQGDHGYKFEENDPLFEEEGCSILYAIYCSDQNYPGWHHSFNSVNGFRLLFNKYFHTGFPTLDNRSYNLYYR